MIDIVVNHMGNQDSCPDGDNCIDINDFSEFTPFNQPEHYHEYCLMESLYDQQLVEDCRLYYLPGGCFTFLTSQATHSHVIHMSISIVADLAQENPVVNDLLLDWINGLTTEYGFDGYRIDTARHVPKSFYPPFAEAANGYIVGEPQEVSVP